MTTGLGIGALVDGPAPRAPLYTLLGAARVIPMGEDEHYLLGLDVRSYPCGPSHAWDGWNHLNDDGTTSKVVITSTPTPAFRSFTVYVMEQCNTRGVSAEAFADRVRAIFPAIEAYAVEREFWTGALLPDSPHLVGEIPVPLGADGTIYPAGDTVKTRTEGLALLEAAIATTGRAGVIHASPSLVTAWAALGGNLVQRAPGNPPTLQTILGTTVVPGSGYQTAAAATAFAGSTPVPPRTHAAPTGTQEWAFATGPIEVRHTADITIIPEPTEAALAQAIDRANNLIEYEASREYVLDWDACFKAAVRIDRAT